VTVQVHFRSLAIHNNSLNTKITAQSDGTTGHLDLLGALSGLQRAN
jgi:hypothetical protein